MMFRTILKKLLGNLSKWAIRKHDVRLFVVAGWRGTEISRELAYQVLGSKFVVRRMVKNVWWDFSVPLAILGYEDHKRNTFAWIWLLFKATVRLIMFRGNPHILILNINYSDTETAKYWASFVKPEILLVPTFIESLPFLLKIAKITHFAGGKIICDYRDLEKMQAIIGSNAKVFTFGQGSGDLEFKDFDSKTLMFSYKQKKYKVKKSLFTGIKPELIASCISIGIVNDVPIMEALYALVKFQMPSRMLQNIKRDLHS